MEARHVTEAVARIARLERVIALINENGPSRTLDNCKETLRLFCDTLGLSRERLARLQRKQEQAELVRVMLTDYPASPIHYLQ